MSTCGTEGVRERLGFFLRQDVSGDGGGATAAGGPRRRVCVSRAEPGCGGARVLGLGSLESLGYSHE